MARISVLVADNDLSFQKQLSEFLEGEGFQIVTAADPIEAQSILEQGDIDLAILDLRLVNDEDDKDESGLILAEQFAPLMPKILLTQFPSHEAAREALSPRIGQLPPAVNFVVKSDGPQKVLTEVRKALQVAKEAAESRGARRKPWKRWASRASLIALAGGGIVGIIATVLSNPTLLLVTLVLAVVSVTLFGLSIVD